MSINTFFLFARNGDCLTYMEWNRVKACENPADEQKLLFGLLFSLKRFCEMNSPSSSKASPDFHSFTTSTYRLHFFETPTGLKFVLFSDPIITNLKEQLLQLHRYYVTYCAKNPLYIKGSPITSDLFLSSVKKYIAGMIFLFFFTFFFLLFC